MSNENAHIIPGSSGIMQRYTSIPRVPNNYCGIIIIVMMTHSNMSRTSNIRASGSKRTCRRVSCQPTCIANTNWIIAKCRTDVRGDGERQIEVNGVVMWLRMWRSIDACAMRAHDFSHACNLYAKCVRLAGNSFAQIECNWNSIIQPACRVVARERCAHFETRGCSAHDSASDFARHSKTRIYAQHQFGQQQWAMCVWFGHGGQKHTNTH